MVVKLKPTWKIPAAKPARDQSGHLRGAIATSPDDSDFIGSWDRNVDAQIFGNQAVGRRERDVMDPTQPKSKRTR
jgi:hypothetical protein